jgi:two-component system, NtrC family, response regulator AtoC
MSLTILIVDDEDNARINIGDFLSSKGYEVLSASNLAEARKFLLKNDADVVLLDVRLPDGYGPSLLHENMENPMRPPMIIITAHGEIEMAVEAMKNGAHDFLQKPVQFSQLEQSIQRAGEIVAMRRELAHFRQSQQADLDFVVGNSPEVKAVLEQAQRAATASVSVLVTGETGTGKEILAKFIHHQGPRSGKPFIAINCAAIQSTMLESELFGYEAGAFTGAEKRKNGLMEVADEGILFLDEISSMPMDIQAKLLRAIEDQSFRRVGGTALIKVDVQVLAASNRDLKKMIKDGLFREDLYYRLKVVDLHLPPLRERIMDIPELVGFFVHKNNAHLGVNIESVSQKALDILKKYKWPGNIRELANAMERAALFCDTGVIEPGNLPTDILKN